jgi:HEAT repeat protein
LHLAIAIDKLLSSEVGNFYMVYEQDINALDDDLDLLDDDPLDRFVTKEEDLNPIPEPVKPDPEQMLPLLKDPVPTQRMLAARAFCEIQDERAIPQLIQLLVDPCALVRVSAAYALGRNPSPMAVEPLINQLRLDWSGYVRKGIVWALGNCRDRRALEPLLTCLKMDIPAVRLWAASSLAQVADLGYETVVATIPAIVQALIVDSVPAVRSNCAWSLGRLCRELPANVVYATAVDALIEVVAADRDLSVREDARASLLKLGDPRGIQAIEILELEVDREDE